METIRMTTKQFKAFLITLLEVVRKARDTKEIEKHLTDLIKTL